MFWSDKSLISQAIHTGFLQIDNVSTTHTLPSYSSCCFFFLFLPLTSYSVLFYIFNSSKTLELLTKYHFFWLFYQKIIQYFKQWQQKKFWGSFLLKYGLDTERRRSGLWWPRQQGRRKCQSCFLLFLWYYLDPIKCVNFRHKQLEMGPAKCDDIIEMWAVLLSCISHIVVGARTHPAVQWNPSGSAHCAWCTDLTLIYL